MAQVQVDLDALGKTIAAAFDASIDLSLSPTRRAEFRDKADALNTRFDQLSGAFFEETAGAFVAASETLGEALDAMEKPLADAANAIAALSLLTSLVGALDSVLGLIT